MTIPHTHAPAVYLAFLASSQPQLHPLHLYQQHHFHHHQLHQLYPLLLQLHHLLYLQLHPHQMLNLSCKYITVKHMNYQSFNGIVME